MQELRQQTLARLQHWLSDYRLPPPDDPLHDLEMAQFKMLFMFFAALALRSQSAHASAGEALLELLPEHPPLPTSGLPSEALRVLGLGRGQGPAYQLQQRLLDELTPEQGVVLLMLTEA